MKVILNPSDISLDPDPALAASDPLVAAFDLLADALKSRCNEPTHYYLELPGAMRLCSTHLSTMQGTSAKWGVDSQKKPCDFRVAGAQGQASRHAWAVTVALRFLDHLERGERVSLPEIAVEVAQ